MIKKLMKYDLQNMLRILAYVYAAAIGIASITRLINIGRDIQVFAILGGFFFGLTVAAVAAVLIITFVQILRVFINSFFKDESYLTHTLPVKKELLLLSKYLSSLIVILVSIAVSFVCLFIILYSGEFIAMLKASLDMAFAGFNLSAWGFVALLISTIFLQVCAMASMCFTAAIKGCSFNRDKLLHGLIWYVIFYFGCTAVTLVIEMAVFLISGAIGEFFSNQLSEGSLIKLLVVPLVLYSIYSVAFYFISQREFKKGVNVD
jgi:hypothetical protein